MMVVRKGRVAAFVMLVRALRASSKPGTPGIGAHIAAVPRMLRLGLTGRYTGLSRPRIFLALLGVLYIVSPIDLMLDLVFGVMGLGGDAVLAAWVAGVLLSETDYFLHWEARQAHVLVGDVVG